MAILIEELAAAQQFDFSSFVEVGPRSSMKKENTSLFNSFSTKYPGICQSRAEFVYWARNYNNPNFLDSLLCKECGKRNSWDSGRTSYTTYCCRACANKSSDRLLKVSETNLSKTGYAWNFQNPAVQKQRAEKFTREFGEGVTCFTQTEEGRRQSSARCLNSDHQRKMQEGSAKFRVENPGIIEEKMRQTNHRLRGVNYVMQDPEVLETARQTNLRTRGVEWPMQDKSVRDLSRQTCLDKFGVEYPAQREEEKVRIAERMSREDVQLHILEVMRKNGTLKSSAFENIVLFELQDRFNEVVTQHMDSRYCDPITGRRWRCDFYLPIMDLFIEIQGTWTHGYHPFNLENEMSQNQLLDWTHKAQSSSYYAAAIYVWTDLDVRKRNCAREQGLNWIEFFTLQEFGGWLATVSPTLISQGKHNGTN